ncbi:glutathione peroxidase [Tateyamaria sp.]|uniref:glutathione peroxidase n=2 Tax=Tateyamaria TaxID=299261 RepID=UPI003B22073E
MRNLLVLVGAALVAATVAMAVPSARFASIDGGYIEMSDWAGQPVLVVNTASQCGFVDQYEGLQTLYDRYRAAGLVVLVVPSDDFNQELDSGAEVKEFCEMVFGLDMPMTDITSVKGRNAHPFYARVRDETGFVPRWNFNKVLVGADGRVIETWGARTPPLDPRVVQAIEQALTGS